ncbi:MAG: DsbA family protein [Pseudomonadota bacterium]
MRAIVLTLVLLLAGTAAAVDDYTDDERAALRAEIRAYLLENPEVLREAITVLEERDAARQLAEDQANIVANAEALTHDGYSYVGGNPDGELTVVEFIDYQCGFCKRAHPDITAIVAADTELRYVVKELPLLGSVSVVAARLAMAVLELEGPEAYATLNDALLEHDGQLSEPVILDYVAEVADVDAAIEMARTPEIRGRLNETRALANAIGLTGTPTFIIGDRMVRGALPRAELEAIVAEAKTDP